MELLWLLPVAITIHMIEEMIWLPKWSQTAGSWHVPVRPGQFAFASIVLIVITFAVTAIAVQSDRGGAAVYVTMGLALTMLLNLYFPHIGSAISLKRYAPGIVTGLLINLPVMSFLIWQAVTKGYVNGLIFLLVGAPLVLIAARGWSFLLYAGSILLK